MAAASSGALHSAPAITMELSVYRDLDALGMGPLICSAWGRIVLAVLGLPGLCLSWELVRSLALSLVPCAPRPVLLDSCSWLGSPSLRSHWLSPLELLH